MRKVNKNRNDLINLSVHYSGKIKNAFTRMRPEGDGPKKRVVFYQREKHGNVDLKYTDRDDGEYSKTKVHSWFSFCQPISRGSVLLLMIRGRKRERERKRQRGRRKRTGQVQDCDWRHWDPPCTIPLIPPLTLDRNKAEILARPLLGGCVKRKVGDPTSPRALSGRCTADCEYPCWGRTLCEAPPKVVACSIYPVLV